MAPTVSLMAIALLWGAESGAAPSGVYAPAYDAVPAPLPPPPAESQSSRPMGGWSVGSLAPQSPVTNDEIDSPEEEQNEAGAPPPLKLAPPTRSENSTDGPVDPPSAAGAVTSIVSSLAVVLGLFFLVVWFARRNGPKGGLLLPSEVLEVLGRSPLTARHQMHVVRFGNKLLLLSVTPAGAEPLAEIDDPAEVERVSGICQELKHGSITETFRQVFSQFANEPARDGFVGAGRE